MAAVHLVPMFINVARLYAAEGYNVIDSYDSFIKTFVPLYMVFFGLVFAFHTMPSVHRVNDEIQGKRSMLLYIPIDVIQKNSSIGALAEEIVGKIEGTVATARISG